MATILFFTLNTELIQYYSKQEYPKISKSASSTFKKHRFFKVSSSQPISLHCDTPFYTTSYGCDIGQP